MWYGALKNVGDENDLYKPEQQTRVQGEVNDTLKRKHEMYMYICRLHNKVLDCGSGDACFKMAGMKEEGDWYFWAEKRNSGWGYIQGRRHKLRKQV